MAEKTENNPRGAGRPKIEDGLKKVNLTVKVPGWVKDEIGGVNASALVTGLLECYFDDQEL